MKMVKKAPFLVGHPESPSGPAGRTTEAKYLDIVRCQSNTNFDWGGGWKVVTSLQPPWLVQIYVYIYIYIYLY